ncbi:hypothetical protein D3C76_1687690 [compost metagenome]
MRLLGAALHQSFLLFEQPLELLLNSDLGGNRLLRVFEIFRHIADILVGQLDRIFRLVDQSVDIGHRQIAQSFKNGHLFFPPD